MTTHWIKWGVGVVLGLLVLCNQAFAVAWDELSDAQRTVLSQYQAQWPGLPAE